MLDQLELNSYYKLLMDNIFSSVKFSEVAENKTKSKVLKCSIARKSGKGISAIVYQDKQKNPKKKAKLVGTLKGVVLKGDIAHKILVSLSVYNTKPVYFFTNCMKEFKWTEKKRKVYDYKEHQQVIITFLQTNFQKFYNSWMNRADIIDHL